MLAAVSAFAGAQAADEGVAVSGLVAHPAHFSLADLRALPAVAVNVTQATNHGPAVQDCKGPALSVLLQQAAPVLGGRNVALAHTLLMTATDGYAVAFSLPELDPDYGGAAPILATDCGGKPLAAPKLVVPSDKPAGRAVHDVAKIELR